MTNYRVKTIVLLLLCAFNTLLAQDPQKAKMTPSGTGYLEYLPADYNSTSKLYPAIIFLHGSGERGTGTASDLERVKATAIPKLIKNGDKMCFTVNGVNECFIVLSPQTNGWGWHKQIVPFATWALQNYRIDPNRLYVTGLSMGGQGTWVTISDEANNPNLFAAAAPIAAKGEAVDGCAAAEKKVAVWAFHGLKDTAISYYVGRKPVDGMKACGGVPLYTEYPDTNHGQTWDRAYRTDHNYHNPNLYEWLLMQKKGASSTPSNKAPVVNAGADRNITLPSNSLTITGTATDSDGTIASVSWKKVSGPSAGTIATPTALTTTFSSLAEGTYVFSLTATDNKGASATDQVSVIVKPATSTAKNAPVVTAGADRAITLPSNSLSITGGATDSDGTISSYAWTQISGPVNGNLANANTKTVRISGIATAGTYTFRFSATDNSGLTGYDDVNVVVNTAGGGSTDRPAPAPSGLTVNAGVDKAINLPTSTASFTASASNASGAVTYSWKQTGGCTISMSNTSSATMTVSGLTPCTYLFEVTAKDNTGTIAKDVVSLRINPALAVNAGADQNITLPTNSATLKATPSNASGISLTYAWTKISGGSITMHGTSSNMLSVSNAVAGTYVFQVKVTSSGGAVATDNVQLTVKGSSVTSNAAARTSFQEQDAIATEHALSLGQNYPNPFSSATTIPVSVDKPQLITLKVFDANGTEVATIFNDNLEAGNHSIALHTSDVSGTHGEVSGVYYYKLFSKDQVITKRLSIVY